MNNKRSAAFPYSVFPLTFLVWVALLCLPERAFGQNPTLITPPGSAPFTVPAGTKALKVEVWGGGGSGGRDAGGGGGGGSYSRSFISAPFSASYPYVIGTGGVGNSSNGGTTSFGTGAVIASAGGGSFGVNSGVGGAGGTASIGNEATTTGGNGNGGSGNSGGAGGSSPNGGIGGPGGANTNITGTSGTVPGGGGGGAGKNSATNASGGAGQIRISYIALTSATNTDAQTVCSGSAISTISYSLPTGSPTVNVTNLPTGVTSSAYNSITGIISITGNPTNFNTYTISVTTSYGVSLTTTGTITVTPNNTVGAASSSPTLCINTALITNITHTTTGTIGISNDGVPGANGLPAGVSASWAGNTITISGTPAASGTFNYSIPLNGCGGIANGTITVTPNQTAAAASATPTICINTALGTNITHATTNTTGITGNGVAGANGLPPGMTATWSAGVITISGTPTSAAGSPYNYSIPITGCLASGVNATGAITVTPNQTTAVASSTPTICINTALGTNITHATTNATGITGNGVAGANGLPPGMTATWSAGVLTISGTPTSTAGSPYNYSIPITGCLTTVFATGTITVTPTNTVTAATPSPPVCSGNAITSITHTITGTTTFGAITWTSNAGNYTSSPGGTMGASLAGTTLTISGTPANSGVFTYTIPLTGGCGSVSATGTITVNAVPVANITSSSFATQSRCINATLGFNALTVEARTGFSYQWYSNTTGSTSSGTQTTVGTNTNTLPPPNNAAGTRYYYVVVSSPTSCGLAITSAVSGAITVNPLPVVSFAAQPSGTQCVDTDLNYSTQALQTAYVWTIPGVLGTDYTITSGGNGSANLVLKWLTPGSKSVTVNYQDLQGCGATSAATSNTITVEKNTVTPPSNPNPSSCYTGAFTSITHTTTFATGIANAGVSGGNGLPLGLSAIWTGNPTSGTITISGTVDPTVTPGPKAYSIPLSGGCGTVAATGIINVEPEYTLTSISSVSPSSTGGSATITLNLIPSTLATGSFVVNYSMGLANPRAATNVTVNFTNGVGTFFTSSVTNENLTSLTINSVRKASDPTSCPVLINANNITFFGIQPRIFNTNGTFYVPAGIFQITVKVYGGGGGGGRGSNGAGGGGGGYSERTISVVPGEAIGIFVGVGGTGQTLAGTPAGNGGTSWVTRDSSPPNLPTTGFAVAYGGNGATVGTPGAGGIGQTSNGIIGGNPNPTPNTGGNGGKGGGVDGGAGGAGGISGNTAAERGKSGLPFGGGGGGSISNRDGGPGASGYVIITYPLPPVGPCFKVIDDGAISGTAIIEFTCNTSWTAPEGLTGFRTTIGGAGGGGGQGSGSGGGGAGQLVHNLTYSTTNPFGLPAGTSFTITVGQGGAGSSFISDRGFVGGTSSISGSIDGSPISASAVGGGGGASIGTGLGMNGSSGGGGAAPPTPPTNFAGGAGTPSRGSSGGRGDASGQGAHAGGGGGGIATVGLDGQGAGAGQGKGGDGGNGVQFTIADSLRNYGGGGGGIGNAFNGANKFNGEGGKVLNVKIGGDGNQDDANSIGYQGQDLTGSGGGAGFFRGGRGGNGVVYIYYSVFRILPVEFLYFNAKLDESNRSGNLSWATAKEWENSHFEIERSLNGVNSWTKIGKIDGQGYSEIPTEYSFTDTKLPAAGGIVYYRLKQVDFNGKFVYSVTKSIKVDGLDGKGAWIAYPNPSSKKSTVTVDLLNRSVYSDEAILIQISDMRGVSETFTVNQIESVSEVVNAYLDRSIQGVYILQLIWGNNSQQLKLLRE